MKTPINQNWYALVMEMDEESLNIKYGMSVQRTGSQITKV